MLTAAEAPSIRKQLAFFELPVKENPTRFEKMISSRKRNTQQRNERISTRFNHLYNVERKRYDDVITQLCEEFNCVETTIEKALKG